MSVYEDGEGKFIYFDGSVKHRFDTFEEAQAAQLQADDAAATQEREATALTSARARKTAFVRRQQEAATQIAQAADLLGNLETVFFDRGYNSGGANAIEDADVVATGLTAAQVGSLITFGQQLHNFLNNETVAKADYDATLNAARTDV